MKYSSLRFFACTILGALVMLTAATAVAQKSSLPKSWSEQIDFRSIGPANMMGRITSIAVHEKDPCIWWAASASGGLLKTINNGHDFEHQFDDQATVSIGDVQVSQKDPNLVWVGTGEANPRNSVSWGDGVYKSTDGGKSWKNMGLKKTFQIGRIAIHPKDNNIVFVGALGRLWGPNEDRGLFKTTDGGKTWEKILYVDDKTGVVDVQMNPKNPDEMLVATYDRLRNGFDDNSPVKRFGGGSAIYRTTDGGKTFAKVSDGLPTCKLGRIGLNYYRKNPKFVYAIVESEKIAKVPENAAYWGLRLKDAEVGARVTRVPEDSPADKAGLLEDDIIVSFGGKIVHSARELEVAVRKHSAGDTVKMIISRERKPVDLTCEFSKAPKSRRSRAGRGSRSPFTGTLGGQRENMQGQQGDEGHEYGGVYLSKDGGSSWKRINTLNPRPMYYSQIRVDPTDRNNMYILGTSLYRSKDGGEKFTGDGGSDGIHVDHHALWIDPNDSRHMILGNDGGIFVTFDRMNNWDHHNHAALGQFYHVSVDSRENYHVFGGLQDNGSWGGPAHVLNDTGPINSDWYRVGGGDGFVTISDPDNPEQIYFESQNGNMGRINLKTGERGFIRPQKRGVRYRFNWKTPFLLSPHNSKIHYSAGNHVFRSFNKGTGIKEISPDITNTSKGAGSALTESPVTPGVLYVGTTDGAVWMTKDGGQNWTPLYSTKGEKKKEGSKDEANESKDKAERPNGSTDQALNSSNLLNSQAALAGVLTYSNANRIDDPISGTWSGILENENLPDGKVEFSILLKMNKKNELSGEITSPQGTHDIYEGLFNAKKNSLYFSGGNDDVTLDFEATLKDGKMSGDLSINDGQLSVTFEATKEKVEAKATEAVEATETADTKTVKATASASAQDEDSKKQDKSDSKSDEKQEKSDKKDAAKETEMKSDKAAKTSSEVAADETKSEETVDVVSGAWKGAMISSRGESELAFTLKRVSDKKITGTYESRRGEIELTEGVFNPKTGKLSIVADSGQFVIEFSGTIKDDTFKGEADFAGRVVREFEMKRVTGPDESDEESSDAAESEKESDAKKSKGTLAELLPGPFWVSSMQASKFSASRCYASFDGHRSNNDDPHLFVSEDYGKSWKSIRGNLPVSAGSVRVLREDITNENLLFLGCEFGGWVSIDRGATWTRLKGLPTVAVHEFAIHPSSGEVVVGTHGRSLWVGDVSGLRQFSVDSIKSKAILYQPNRVISWRRTASRGSSGTRKFTGENRSGAAVVQYSLGRNARSVELTISNINGDVVQNFADLSTRSGLHTARWDMRRSGMGRRGGSSGPGTYLVTLTVDGQVFKKNLKILRDPTAPASAVSPDLEMEFWLEEMEADDD